MGAADDDEPDEGGPVPWHRNPVVWSVVVVAAIVLALVVSLTVGSDPRDPDLADMDHTTFCAQAQTFRGQLADTVDPTRDTDAIRTLSDSMRKMESLAPEVIRPAAKDWADGLSDAARKLDLVLANNPNGGTIPDYDRAIQVVEEVGQEKSIAIDRVTNYTRKACSIDISQPPPPPQGSVGTIDTGTFVPEPVATNIPEDTSPPPDPNDTTPKGHDDG